MLLETRSNDPVSSGLQALGEIGVESGVLLGGQIGAEELFSGLTRVTSRLKQNKMDFGADGQITEDEASKLGRLNRFIEVTLERFKTENIQRDPNLLSVARTVRSANLGSFADPGTMFAVQENEGVFQRLERILATQVELMQEQLQGNQENGKEHQTIRLTQRQAHRRPPRQHPTRGRRRDRDRWFAVRQQSR